MGEVLDLVTQKILTRTNIRKSNLSKQMSSEADKQSLEAKNRDQPLREKSLKLRGFWLYFFFN